MPWLVIKFNLENTVEAVPKNWYCKETFSCYWPPDTCNHSISEKIKNQYSPDPLLWETHPAEILGQYDDFKIAKKKANKAKSTNELSSNNEDFKKKKILKKHKDNKTRHNTDTDNTSLDEYSNNGNSYPVTSFLNLEKSVNDTHQITVQHKRTEKNINNASNSIVISKDAFSKYQLLNSKYQEEVLKEINLLHLKINDISDSIKVIINSAKVNTETVVQNDRSEVLKIIHLFPMTEESLIEVEDWINSSIDNKEALTKELSHIGGTTLKELIKKLMYRLFFNEVGMLYSWEGAKKKKVFKNLNIAAVILDVVRVNPKFQNATEIEAINYIKSWLVRSKDRYNNGERLTKL
ncbi:uncharacterized protein LOC113003541 [Solenopsis invicta]|uniref:uncharacterized protein LOC113003541 n=1 Tax=Solenopsis invicta TaxID=13686 RepID=UPI00193D8C7B|nr:uncharacterized protein LOC113003541 [Solenopsis invicta]XP_039302732.1 uncharacterized protein LOC113003541 [Solenopsis invicta]